MTCAIIQKLAHHGVSFLFSHFSLHRLLLKSLYELNFREPTPVQVATIPIALDGVDLQVSSETGSGKTLAYLLPLLHRLLSTANPDAGIRALILLPTRELAQQVFTNCQDLAKHSNLDSTLIIGGSDFEEQAEQVIKDPQIIVATVGRLLEHLDRGLLDLNKLDVLVLDEADRMLDMGFADDVLKISMACNHSQRQTLLFSATLKNKWLHRITNKVLREPEKITITRERGSHANIQEQVILADNEKHKVELILWLLANETYKKALIFTNSRNHADSLSNAIIKLKQHVGVLHGEIDSLKRERVLALLREDKLHVLIATDVAARGLDIEGVDLVINFEMPRRGDDYTHRIGRTGRAGKQGLAITLIKSTEWNLKANIERYLEHKFEPRIIEALPANYTGPKQLKTSGRAVGTKRKKEKKKVEIPKLKQRHRDKKNVGKRRKPTRLN